MSTCPLCLSEKNKDVAGPDHRNYYLCENCELIFIDKKHFLSVEEETTRYQKHENSINNKGYVSFLKNAIQPMLPYLLNSMRGLDYGCGPVPTLSLLLKQNEISCENYDPIFFDITLNPPYDFIFSTECFEHFFSPSKEISRIKKILKPGGYLAVMTELWEDSRNFKDWYYMRDPAHVCFYHAKTVEYICKEFGFEQLFSDGKRVFVLRNT